MNLRTELLDYQRQFFADARNEASKSSGAIVFGDEKDAAKTYHLAQILARHQIEFHELASDYSSNGKNYKKGYAYVVPKNQKHHRLINAMFEKRTKFQDSLFYDISAWTFPLAFNLDYEENTMSRAGKKVTELKFPGNPVTLSDAYAYLMEWHEYYTPKALNMLHEAGIRLKVSLQPFSLEGKDYDYGTIMIPVQNQKLDAQSLKQVLQKVAQENHVNINGVSTGLSKGVDLGSRKFATIKPQKVGLLVGQGIRSYDAGEIWHLFDTRYAMEITKLDITQLGSKDLSKYTDIIIPSASGSSLNKSVTEKLKEWTKEGGTLIAFRSTGQWLNDSELLKMTLKTKKDTASGVSFEEKRNYSGAQRIGGAIFEAKIDRSHPINFGYKNDRISLFRNSTLFVEPSTNSYDNPIQYTDKPLLSGYISDKNAELIKNTVPLKIGKLGRGKIIYFTDNTNFRAFWYGTNKLLMNAIFFGDNM